MAGPNTNGNEFTPAGAPSFALEAETPYIEQPKAISEYPYAAMSRDPLLGIAETAGLHPEAFTAIRTDFHRAVSDTAARAAIFARQTYADLKDTCADYKAKSEAEKKARLRTQSVNAKREALQHTQYANARTVVGEYGEPSLVERASGKVLDFFRGPLGRLTATAALISLLPACSQISRSEIAPYNMANLSFDELMELGPEAAVFAFPTYYEDEAEQQNFNENLSAALAHQIGEQYPNGFPRGGGMIVGVSSYDPEKEPGEEGYFDIDAACDDPNIQFSPTAQFRELPFRMIRDGEDPDQYYAAAAKSVIRRMRENPDDCRFRVKRDKKGNLYTTTTNPETGETTEYVITSDGTVIEIPSTSEPFSVITGATGEPISSSTAGTTDSSSTSSSATETSATKPPTSAETSANHNTPPSQYIIGGNLSRDRIATAGYLQEKTTANSGKLIPINTEYGNFLVEKKDNSNSNFSSEGLTLYVYSSPNRNGTYDLIGIINKKPDPKNPDERCNISLVTNPNAKPFAGNLGRVIKFDAQFGLGSPNKASGGLDYYSAKTFTNDASTALGRADIAVFQVTANQSIKQLF